MIYKFTNKAKKVIEIANDISVELGHNYIGTEHILYGLVKEGSGVAAKVLESQEIENTNKNEQVQLINEELKPIEEIAVDPTLTDYYNNINEITRILERHFAKEQEIIIKAIKQEKKSKMEKI